MKNHKKRVFSFLLTIVMAVSLLPAMQGEAKAANVTLQSLQNQFPNGKYWNHAGSSANNPGGWTSTPCTHHPSKYDYGNCDETNGTCGCNSYYSGSSCVGFVNYLTVAYYGSVAYTWPEVTNVNSLKAGDVIRYLNDTHSAWVIGVSGNTVTLAECNLNHNCNIVWGRQISKSEIAATLTRVRSAPYALKEAASNSGDSSVNPPVTFGPWEQSRTTFIKETNACIGQAITIPSGNCADSGMYLYDQNGKYLAFGHNNQLSRWYGYVYFDINKELNYTLKPGTTYKYKFYVVYNGKEYWSDFGTFTTKGQAPTANPTVTFGSWEQSGKTYIGETDASIGQAITIPSGNPTDSGMFLYHQSGSLLAIGSNGQLSRWDGYVYFKINEDLHYILSPGTTYKYKFYVVYNGKTYSSDFGTFTTKGHTHSLQRTAAKSATCTAEGNTEYWSCSSCGKIFSDSKGTKEITQAQAKVAALGHNYVSGKCTCCGAAQSGQVTAQATAQLSVESKTATAGSTVTVPVRLQNNPGVTGFMLQIDYDSSKLELLRATSGTSFSGMEINASNPVRVLWTSSSQKNVTGTGTVLELTFRVKNGVSGQAQIKVTPGDAENASGNVSMNTVSGTVTVATSTGGSLRGDVNGDGTISLRDVTSLRKYLVDLETDINTANADVNGDGTISLRDVTALQKYLIGLISSLN